MDDGAPTLEVGFEIDASGAFGSLVQLDGQIDSTVANAVAEFERVKRASTGMLNLGGATAEVVAFGNAQSRSGQIAEREYARAEKAGEALSRQLARQSAEYGKTRDEIRAMKVEAAAAAAEQQGLSELANRLRTQEMELFGRKLAAERQARFEAEATAEAEARSAAQAVAARNAETAAAERAARQHAELAAMVRNSHAAQEADAASAERLRMATDPLYAATQRLNAQIAESTRLYYAGVTPTDEYARQQGVLAERLREVERASNSAGTGFTQVGSTGRIAGHHMQNLAFQFQDVGIQMFAAAQSSAPFKMGLMALIQQGGQIQMIMSQAGVGIRAVGAAFVSMLVPFLPVIAAVGVAAGAFALFNRQVSQGIDTKAMVNSLGLTRAEIKRLKDTSVDTGDVVKATFQVLAQRLGINLGNIKKFFADALDFMTVAARNSLAGIYASFVGTFRAIGAIVKGVFEGKGLSEILSDVGGAYKGAFDEANTAMTEFGADVTKQLASNKLKELRAQAEEIKKDRTPKKDRHAEQLAREAEATEAQIRNLYSLADAYNVSGAAALIAEARVKAESAAIKKRADIEAAVDRQVRLAIAQRVSDAAKAAASQREQAEAQKKVNDMVVAGLVPADRAADLVKDQIADLPLLAALQAAQQRGLATEAARATKALADQRIARERLRDEEERQRFNAAIATGSNRLAELREEIRLIGATDAAREHALATLKATQEASVMFDDPARRAAYIAQQVRIADETARLAAEQRAWNDQLTFTADMWDLIARNVQSAAQGMAEAFGSAGRALGDMAAIYADYRAQEERAAVIHQQNMANARTEAEKQRELAKFNLFTSTAQVGLYGDMASAAKGFFKTGSDGYKALQKAEQVFRAVQFALSVRAMAQDAIETGAALAKSAARTAANAVEAVTKAIASLPFPANLAAGAATIAALAAIGVSIAGSFGGGKKPPETNTGTGTVFGDTAAKSDSIKRAIDSLKEVDTLTNTYAREMAGSLRSIESQIGGFAALIVRAGDINASAGVNTGFEANLLGKTLGNLPFAFLGPLGVAFSGVIKKIPIIGDILGGIGGVMQSLFGSKKTIVGSGLFGGPQSLGSILNGGFDAQYFSDIQKKKRFFGITTGTSYSTKFGAADPTLENQFTLILRSFNDAIAAAAGPLGASTSDIEARLRGFVVNIGKIDLKGLTGEQIEEKLEAIFGAAADNMANAAFPGIAKFQKVGEGAFETLVRVASTVEAVTNAPGMLGGQVRTLGIDAKMGLAGQFDSIGAFTSAVDNYFEKFFSKEEQAAARTAELARVFGSLGLTMPPTLAAFRGLVEAQDLTTQAGQQTYATLLKLAPAFADLQTALSGAKSAAEILSERQDLQRRLLELMGDTAAIRVLDLAKLDPSNRALQEQIWAIEDAKEAARAAEELRKAWTSVGDSIMDEVKRIRGLTGADNGGGFAMLMGQFNASTASARAGDQDAAKSLPGLSQALLTAAAQAATSRQELDRVRAQTAASLEATYSAISAFTGSVPSGASMSDIVAAAAATQAASAPPAANDDLVAEVRSLREEVTRLRNENNSGHAATASNTGSMKRTLDNITQESGGDAVSVVGAAA